MNQNKSIPFNGQLICKIITIYNSFRIESFGLYKLGGPNVSELIIKMHSDQAHMEQLKEVLNGRIGFQYIGAFFHMTRWII